MTEVDPDPQAPDESNDGAVLGGRAVSDAGDPTEGGRRGAIGETPSIAADQPEGGTGYRVGGGRVAEEPDTPPVAELGPDA